MAPVVWSDVFERHAASGRAWNSSSKICIPFAHLYLGQHDTYGTDRVDEEVGAQSTGPPVAAGPPALGVDTDAEAPAGTGPKAREEAVRRLGDSRHLVAG